MVGSRGRCGRGRRALGEAPPLVDRVHLGGEELQAATQVALLAEQGLLVAQHLAVLRLQRLQGMDDFDFKMLHNEFVTQVKGTAQFRLVAYAIPCPLTLM